MRVMQVRVNNYFHHAVLEYSEDGSEGSWTQIGGVCDFQRHISEEVEIEARYIPLARRISGETGKPDHWTTIREIIINGNEEEEKFGVCTNMDTTVGEVSHQEGNLQLGSRWHGFFKSRRVPGNKV